ncbi:MAG: GNAT family N-acetyltransferase [Bacillota bacterium]
MDRPGSSRPNQRGQGLGRRFCLAFEEWSCSQGAVAIELGVTELNTAADRLAQV